jgi:phospholipid/cholesterol/gamma-HCH transport system ATP-binding protein
VIEIAGLCHQFGKKLVLNDINLSVETGEILAVMGSSGGGKTTLLRCIAGLISPTKGEISVDGINSIQNPEQARRSMGMVFQNAALFDYLTVEQNVLFGLQRHTKFTATKQKELVQETLHQVGLDGNEHLFPAELSGGMRKRVGMARAIVLQPKVILFDEPTTGLDPITTFQIDELILESTNAHNITALLVSHDLISVRRVADRVAFLHSGELVFIGTPNEFMISKHPAIAELVQKTQATSI